MADTPKPDEAVEREASLKAAIEDPEIPKLYANSFGVALTNADIIIVFQRFGPRPVAVVNLSYTLAKTLAQRLGALVSHFETEIAKQNILTTERIDEAVKNLEQSKAASAESGSAKSEEANVKSETVKSEEVH
jgi:hypothetical protein